MNAVDSTVENILDKGETILWSGKSNLSSTMIKAGIGALIVLAIGYALNIFNIEGATCKINGQAASPESCGRILEYIQIATYMIAVLIPIFAYLYWKVTFFAITSTRVLIKSGLIGADLKTIYYDQIRNSFVNVGLVDKFFNTGTILIDTGQIRQSKNGTTTIYDKISNVDAPYDAYKKLQSSLVNRKDGMHSGRADFENNRERYEDFIRETEKIRRS